jgi:hypothetical protein
MPTTSGGDGQASVPSTDPPVGPASSRAMHGLRLAIIDDRDGPLPGMLVALTVLAGVVDASSILGLGHVFVATVTGNLVFVGLATAGAQGFSVAPCLLLIGGFTVGALAGGHACRTARGHRGRALRNVLGVKVALGGGRHRDDDRQPEAEGRRQRHTSPRAAPQIGRRRAEPSGRGAGGPGMHS